MARRKNTGSNNGSETSRKIYFYRTRSGTEESGLPKIYDPARALATIDSLPWDDKGRYMQAFPGEKVMMWVESLRPPFRLILGKSRYSNLPHSEQGGARSGIPLDPAAGLNEVIHLVWFAKNIIGAEYNHYGPRLTSGLHAFMSARAAKLYEVAAIEQLIYGRPEELIAQLQGIKMFDLKISRGQLDLLESADHDLKMALETQALAGDAEDVELKLTAKRQKGATLADRIASFTRLIVGKRNFHEGLKTLKIGGEDRATGRSRVLDLLEDRFIVEATMLKVDPRSRAVTSGSAFNAIEVAYTKMREDLERAAAVS
jgi:hypothetical protein